MKGRFLNSGRCAEVYEWNEAHVVKVFHPEFAADAELEFKNNQAIKDVGIPSPLAESIVKVDGLTSIVFERIQGMSMLEHILANPSAPNETAFRLGQLHAQMHNHSCTSLPKQVDYLRNKIERADIDETVRVKALYCLEQLPQEDKLCHGDFHPGNVMITQTSPMIIDWVTATQGNPLADIVWTRLLFTLDNLPDDAPNRVAINSVRPILDDWYCKGYREVRDMDDEALRPWVFPVAVARLGDGILSERQQLLSLIQKYDNDHRSEEEIGIPTNKPNTIDEYISGFSTNVGSILEEIRSTIRSIVPQAEESISYGMPTYTLDGITLIHFAAHKNHIGLYPVPTDGTFEQEFAPYKTSGRGTVQFPYNKPVPQELIAKIVNLRSEKIKGAGN